LGRARTDVIIRATDKKKGASGGKRKGNGSVSGGQREISKARISRRGAREGKCQKAGRLRRISPASPQAELWGGALRPTRLSIGTISLEGKKKESD